MSILFLSSVEDCQEVNIWLYHFFFWRNTLSLNLGKHISRTVSGSAKVSRFPLFRCPWTSQLGRTLGKLLPDWNPHLHLLWVSALDYKVLLLPCPSSSSLRWTSFFFFKSPASFIDEGHLFHRTSRAPLRTEWLWLPVSGRSQILVLTGSRQPEFVPVTSRHRYRFK